MTFSWAMERSVQSRAAHVQQRRHVLAALAIVDQL
jgi:hypothetical protein